MTGPTIISAGRVSIAPVGADPTDESAWTDIGWADPDALKFHTTEGDEHLDMIRAWQSPELEAEYQSPFKDPAMTGVFPWLAGLDVIESPYVPAHSVFLGTFEHKVFIPRATMRPYNDVERAGEWAKRAVRHGLADVLAWLGQDVGRDPDDAWTDELWKLGLSPFPITTDWSIP